MSKGLTFYSNTKQSLTGLMSSDVHLSTTVSCKNPVLYWKNYSTQAQIQTFKDALMTALNTKKSKLKMKKCFPRLYTLQCRSTPNQW